MAEERHIVRFWRGTRDSYNSLVRDGITNYWTRYTVAEDDGRRTEYFGTTPVTLTTGQLYPVDDIVSSLPNTLTDGDRYLVGHDASGDTEAEYYVVEIHTGPNNTLSSTTIINPLGSMSVRVKSRNLFNYQIIDGKLRSYEECFDCGSY